MRGSEAEVRQQKMQAAAARDQDLNKQGSSRANIIEIEHGAVK